MSRSLGPWATAVAVPGESPRLGASWKRRLAQLSVIPPSRGALTRREVVGLGVAGLVAGAIPLLRVTAEEPAGAGAVRWKGKLLVLGVPNPAVRVPKRVPGVVTETKEVVPDAPDPDYPSPNGYLFQAWSPDGGPPITVAEVPGHACYGRLAPDALRLAYLMPAYTIKAAFVPPRGYHLWILTAEGERSRLAEDIGPGYVGGWSPDGTKIACNRQDRMNNPTRYESLLVDATTGATTPVELERDEVISDWSPDGMGWLTETRPIGPPGEARRVIPQVRRVSLDGKDRRRLGDPGRGNHSPRYSPDGGRIVFLSSTRDEAQVCVMDRDGRDLRPIVTARRGEPFVYFSNPCWSPDGRRIAALRYERPAARAGRVSEPPTDVSLIVVDAEGGEPRRLTPAGESLSDEGFVLGLDWR